MERLVRYFKPTWTVAYHLGHCGIEALFKLYKIKQIKQFTK